ncbi:MAG: hypothetical protein DRO76_02930 [Candidatus Altiarchaeales archaeon]|nr:MAG: hypothetical protein DRO76_02930 [Candidatus Altiarchaeales archaeon]
MFFNWKIIAVFLVIIVFVNFLIVTGDGVEVFWGRYNKIVYDEGNQVFNQENIQKVTIYHHVKKRNQAFSEEVIHIKLNQSLFPKIIIDEIILRDNYTKKYCDIKTNYSRSRIYIRSKECITENPISFITEPLYYMLEITVRYHEEGMQSKKTEKIQLTGLRAELYKPKVMAYLTSYMLLVLIPLLFFERVNRVNQNRARTILLILLTMLAAVLFFSLPCSPLHVVGGTLFMFSIFILYTSLLVKDEIVKGYSIILISFLLVLPYYKVKRMIIADILQEVPLTQEALSLTYIYIGTVTVLAIAIYNIQQKNMKKKKFIVGLLLGLITLPLIFGASMAL